MSFIEWSDKYCTGIPDIDKEHKVLFSLINDLFDKVENGSAHETVSVTIDALQDYVNYHFSREEGLLDLCGYQERDQHISGHRKLQSQMSDFKEAYENNPDDFDMANFMAFLTQWLQGHILQSDMAYVPCVQLRIDSVVDVS